MSRDQSSRRDQPSFAGGEISPEVSARYDTAKYQTALARGRNVLIAAAGGVYNRAGFQFGARVRDSARKTRVIPFQFSVEQGYAIELGHHVLRILYQGGLVLKPELKILGINNSNPAQILVKAHGYVAGQQIYFSGIEGMTEINNRVATVSAVLDANNFLVDLDASGWGVFTGSGGGIDGDANGGEGGYPAIPVYVPPPFENVEPPPVFIPPNFSFQPFY